MKQYPDATERRAKADEWFDGKMNELKEEVARVNSKGWVHGDIEGNTGNVRWDKGTGKPFLIDWGKARDWEQKVKELKASNKDAEAKRVEKVDRINQDAWRTLFDPHVDNWTDKQQQQGTTQTAGSTNTGGDCG
jgi:tRNA A-37 threonylcarbamoyl transferase component Bud32